MLNKKEIELKKKSYTKKLFLHNPLTSESVIVDCAKKIDDLFDLDIKKYSYDEIVEIMIANPTLSPQQAIFKLDTFNFYYKD